MRMHAPGAAVTLSIVVCPHGPSLARGRHPLAACLTGIGAKRHADAIVAVSPHAPGERVLVSTGVPRVLQDYVTTQPDELNATYAPRDAGDIGSLLVQAGRRAALPVAGSMDAPLDAGHWTPLVHLAPGGAPVVGTSLGALPVDALHAWGSLLSHTLDPLPRDVWVVVSAGQAPHCDAGRAGPLETAWNARLLESLRRGTLGQAVLEGLMEQPPAEGGVAGLALLAGVCHGRRVLEAETGPAAQFVALLQ